jgi:hypothetical protein
MDEKQAYELLRIINAMILAHAQGRPITSQDLQEWSRQLAWLRPGA